MGRVARIGWVALLWTTTGCFAATFEVTRLEVADPHAVELRAGDALGPTGELLVPAGSEPVVPEVLLVAGASGGTDVPKVEVARAEDGAITLTCRACVTAWLDVVSGDGAIVLRAPAAGLMERREAKRPAEVPFRMTLAERRTPGSEADEALYESEFVQLWASTEWSNVERVTETITRRRSRHWSVPLVLAAVGLGLGVTGSLVIATGRPEETGAGIAILVPGVLLVGAAGLDLAWPTERRTEVVHYP